MLLEFIGTCIFVCHISKRLKNQDIIATFLTDLVLLITGEEVPPVQHAEFDGALKVIVPRGMVVAVSKADPELVLWKREVSTCLCSSPAMS